MFSYHGTSDSSRIQCMIYRRLIFSSTMHHKSELVIPSRYRLFALWRSTRTRKRKTRKIVCFPAIAIIERKDSSNSLFICHSFSFKIHRYVILQRQSLTESTRCGCHGFFAPVNQADVHFLHRFPLSQPGSLNSDGLTVNKFSSI